MTTRLWSCLAVLLVVIVSVGEAQQQAPPPPPQTAPPATPRAAPSSGPRASTVTVTVTDDAGAPVQGVTVTVTGPVTRTVTTIANGTARLLGMRSGNYRLRFEHQGFITLERDVTMRAGAVPEIDVTLSPGAAPPPPTVEETQAREKAPPESEREQAPPGDPRYVTIVDFLDKNLIGGREPSKRDELGCTASARTTLLQLRESGKEEARTDADEMLYVVAGEGTLRLGNRDLPLSSSTTAIVPRGTVRGLTRKGRNPLIVLSVVSGPPCTK
jgi:mannose-6-phosphate isomerase-like protein (cupin superfamily)